MSSATRKLEEQVAAWPRVSVARHRFGGREFRFDKAEIGHVHSWGDVDIPFTRAMREVLLAEHLAQPHRWLPDSGWISFHIGGEADLAHAEWLMRLSWLRYALKFLPEPSLTLQQECVRLHLGENLIELLVQFFPARASTREPIGSLSA